MVIMSADCSSKASMYIASGLLTSGTGETSLVRGALVRFETVNPTSIHYADLVYPYECDSGKLSVTRVKGQAMQVTT